MCHNSLSSSSLSLIALGANLPGDAGQPEDTLRAALAALGDSGLTVQAVSRFFRTPCFPAGAGPDYVNAAASLNGFDAPEAVLRALHRVEDIFGRARGQRWGMRTLDLDLIAMADAVRPDPETFRAWHGLDLATQMQKAPDHLILPHPRLHERAFVLIPLCDIAPDWRHPVLGQTMREMADALPNEDKDAVQPL